MTTIEKLILNSTDEELKNIKALVDKAFKERLNNSGNKSNEMEVKL